MWLHQAWLVESDQRQYKVAWEPLADQACSAFECWTLIAAGLSAHRLAHTIITIALDGNCGSLKRKKLLPQPPALTHQQSPVTLKHLSD